MNKLYLVCFIAILCAPISGNAQGKLLETKDPSIARMESNRKTDAPFSILFKEDAPYKLSDADVIFTKYLGLRNNTDELRVVNNTTASNINITRFQQYYKGVKVEHGNYSIATSNDKVSYVLGDFYTIADNTSIVPIIDKQTAFTNAWIYLDNQVPSTETLPAITELVFVEDDFKTVQDGKVYLAYKFFISSHKVALKMNDIYIDATTGKILFTNTHINSGCFKVRNAEDKKNTMNKNCSSTLSPDVLATTANTIYSGNVNNMQTIFNGTNYRLETTVATEGSPTHVRNVNHALVSGFTTVAQFTSAIAASTEITDADNNWTTLEYANANKDNTALDVAWGAQRVYDYWKVRHGRNSWNNADGVINCFVHGDNNWDNAFWQGSGGINSMFYGDGSNIAGGFSTLTSIDVTAHEIGHGVCQATSNLTYSKESGGMNEGFSDIWGASVEHYADPHETDATAKSYFDIGEEISNPLNGVPLRKMNSPKSGALSLGPDTYLGTNWVSTTTPTDVGGDNWGVHTNSAILNKWFTLVVSGGTGINDIASTYAVSGIGWIDAEKIAYATELALTATSGYTACRTASINAAATLFGACSLQTEAVTRAWYAVGVGANFIPCTAQIGFKDVLINVNENAGIFTCPATKTATIRMMVDGPAPTGGNASVTVTATGTATNGQDFTIGTGTATFVAGSTADQNIILNIIDDAAVEGNENIKLDFTVTPNGSTASKSNTYTQAIINIIDNDTIPETGSNLLYAPINSFNTTTNNTSAFRSAARTSRSQFLWTAAELTAAGVLPNVPISAISFEMITKNSTIPFTGYTISFANTAITAMTAYVAAASLTQAYTGNYTTTAGKNTITLTTPFVWNGTSNVVMQACFTNAAAGSANDAIQGYTAASGTTVYTAYVTGTTSGCALTGITSSATKPYIAFTQTIPASPVETAAAATRSQQTFAGTNSYFYSSANKKIIAAVTNNNNDLGCVTASVTAAGTTFTALPAGFSGANRSSKEVSITPTSNAATTNYNATIYFTDAELAGKAPASLLLIKTNAATDVLMDASNTKMVTPIVVTGTNYKGFTANFTGFSRFFLIDKPATVLPISGLIIEASLQSNQALVKWKTATENNSAHFIVERSYDGINFNEIKQTIAAGNSASEKHYSLLDNDIVKAINYYRVKLVNTDGSSAYSAIVSVRVNTKESMLAISPNPIQDIFTIQYNNAANNKITIVDATGRKMAEVTPTSTSGSITVDASKFAAGVYMAVFTDKNNKTITQKFIKQ
jgi:Zn-dependent metalloprotease